MPRGRKKGVRLTTGDIEKARKKIKNTPKRGRWPRWDNIHEMDIEDYIMLMQHPDRAIKHPKYGTAVFVKTLHRGEEKVWDPHFEVFLPDEYKVLGAIRFRCDSYDPNGGSLLDTTCLNRCERISCPYYKKGFVTETLANRTFEEDFKAEMDNRHNKKEIAKEEEK